METIEMTERKENTGMQFRALEIKGKSAEVDGERTMHVSFSSEYPVLTPQGFYEILDHNPASIRSERYKKLGLPVLYNHEESIGRTKSIEFTPEKRGEALLRFSKSQRAQDTLRDIDDGILTDTSVGYKVYRLRQEGMLNNKKLFRAVDWQPFEVSVLPVGSDPTVGPNRGLNDATETIFEEEKEKAIMTEEEKKAKEAAAEAAERAATIQVRTANPLPPLDEAAIRSQAIKDEQTRVREIGAMADRNAILKDAAKEYIQSGKSVAEFRGIAFEKLSEASAKQNVVTVDMSTREADEYSIVRGLRDLAFGNGLQGIEKEIHDEIVKQRGKPSAGLYIPSSLKTRTVYPLLTATTNQGGGYTVPTLLQPLIELLRNKMVLVQLGARVLSGLSGVIAFPRQTAAATLSWTGENPGSDVAESNATLDQPSLSPKSAQATTQYSKQLLQQSSIDIENFVRQDLVLINALGLDYAGINGAGASNEPKGILKDAYVATGAGAVAYADADATDGIAPAWKHIIGLESAVMVGNADVGALNYLTNPKVTGKLKQVVKATYQEFIMGNDGRTNGYNVGVSNQVPSTLVKGSSGAVCSAIIFGNFNDLFIGEFGAIELLVDPYAKKKQGLVEITSIMMADIMLRHSQSFSSMQCALTT